MKKVQCVLFDLDGTLVDSMGDLVFALSSYLQSIGITTFKESDAYNVNVHSATAFLEVGLGRLPTDTELQDFVELYARTPREHTKEYADVADMLSELTARNIPWGIITNKPQAIGYDEITKLGYREHGVCDIYGDTLPVKKPHPEPLLLGAQLANIDPTLCVYVGDSASDIQAGINAGMQTIGVTYGYSKAEKLQDANKVVDSVEQLHQLLLDLV